jgi:hypothetical protein
MKKIILPQENNMEKAIKTVRNPSPAYNAMDRCKAVLSVWSEKRKPVEVCREYKIKWVVLGQWQDRALEGMLQALEPRVNLEKGPALSNRLQQLLEKRSHSRVRLGTGTNRLAARLARLQGSKATEKQVMAEDRSA